MANFLRSFFAAAIGIALGLLATWMSVERGYGFGAVNAGPWTAWPKTGSSDADPYARAVMARTGEVPLGVAEGLSFIARTDDTGRILDGRCEYSIRSPVPNARFWTLTPMTSSGGRAAPEGTRAGFTSSEIVYGPEGRFVIQLSEQVRPGNWLPLRTAGNFILMLRLYDTQLASTTSGIDKSWVPAIVRGACS